MMKFTRYLLLLLCLLSLHNSVVAAEPNISLNLNPGKEHLIFSKHLSAEQSLLVRLPQDYHTSQQRYPVVLILDANDFYKSNFYQDAVALIEQLERFGDIPETIVIGVQNDSWYQHSISQPRLFQYYLQQELLPYVEQSLRTLNDRTLVGHSYAAAFASLARSNKFNNIASISPVYPDNHFIEKVVSSFEAAPAVKSILHLYSADESLSDINILIGAAKQHNISFKHHSMQLENHHSIVTTALKYNLKEHFSDYRAPSRHSLQSQIYQIKDVENYFTLRSKRYELNYNESDIQNAVTSIAQDYLELKRFELAFPLWDKSTTRHKEYFLNRSATQFYDRGDTESASKIWRYMTKALSQSPLAFYQLKKLAQQSDNIDLAQFYQKQLSRILLNFESVAQERVFTQFGYHLLQEKQFASAIEVFQKIAIVSPKSSNAFDSLSEAYEAGNYLQKAIEAETEALRLAKMSNNANIKQISHRLQQLEAKLVVNLNEKEQQR